ncbi:MAG: hypothetical protein ACLFTT_09210 [Candidatus Hydrogenedentota bacterium]
MSGAFHTGTVVTSTEGPLRLLCRWTARGLAVLLMLMVIVFAVYEGVPNPFLVSWHENVTNGLFGLMFLGLYLGLQFERLGGVVVLAGFVGFTAATYAITHSLWLGPVHTLFAVAGVLYLLGRRVPPERRGF